MDDASAILEEAIADVGYWRWWTERLPDLFQVEFGGVQLWTPPTQAGSAPPGTIALQFDAPTLVVFLADKHATNLPDNWHIQLHDDQIEPFTITYGEFSLAADSDISSITKECATNFLVGSAEDLKSTTPHVRLAFRSGETGLIVQAQSFRVLSLNGELDAVQIAAARAKWWEYWHEYWQHRDSAAPMPYDYACEVTIPVDHFAPEHIENDASSA